MKANNTLKRFLPCLTVLAVAMNQAYAYDEEGGTRVSGSITPKVTYFNYAGGPGAGLTPYLQSYGGEESWDGDRSDGFFADFDLSLTLSNEERDVLRLDRVGYGPDNHRARLWGGNEAIGITGYYSHFRTNSGGVDYVIRPGTKDNPVADIPPYVASGGGGYLTLFNDDSAGQTSYKVERTRYGMGVKFKPELLGRDASVSLKFDGYDREGNTFATWVAGNGDIRDISVDPAGANSADQRRARWRGYDKPVDQNMGRFSVNLTTSPGGLFQFAYDGSLEKFNSRARTATMTDFQSIIEANPDLWLRGDAELHFVPDSTLMTHAFRGSKTFNNTTAVAAGFGLSRLEQDSFSAEQVAVGYDKGEINSENAFFSVNHRLSSSIALEGSLKYYNRDNDSTTAPPGGTLDRTVEDEWGVRINNLETFTYGLSATFSGLPARSSLTAGWERVDTDRDLQYNDPPDIGAWPTIILYRDATVSDEFYLKWIARPMPGMTLRVTPSIITADKTGFVTEAEDSLNLKVAAGYALTAQTHLNGYYHYKNKENDDLGFTDTDKSSGDPATFVLGTEYKQKADNTFHSAGIGVNHAPSEWVNLNASLNWAQNDFETYYFGTNRRRFEVNNIVFDPRGDSTFKVDTWSLTLTGDYQPTDQLKLRAGYTLSQTDGDLTTTTIALGDVVRDKIDHTLHSLALGADYAWSDSWTLKGAYYYDHYDDKAYSDIDGGRHAIMMGVSMRF